MGTWSVFVLNNPQAIVHTSFLLDFLFLLRSPFDIRCEHVVSSLLTCLLAGTFNTSRIYQMNMYLPTSHAFAREKDCRKQADLFRIHVVPEPCFTIKRITYVSAPILPSAVGRGSGQTTVSDQHRHRCHRSIRLFLNRLLLSGHDAKAASYIRSLKLDVQLIRTPQIFSLLVMHCVRFSKFSASYFTGHGDMGVSNVHTRSKHGKCMKHTTLQPHSVGGGVTSESQ